MKEVLLRLSYKLSYFGNPPWNTGVSPPELLDFIQEHPPGRAIDLGCGTGTNAITLAKNGWQVTGVDFVSKAIRKARKKAERAGVTVRFIVDDVTQLKDINGSFDLVLDIGCLHSLTDHGKARYLTNLERLLAPEGYFLLYTWIKTSDNDSGLGEADLTSISEQLLLKSRQDGSERGKRPSAWFSFQRVDNKMN
jgi:SAM-dependent methyltransferase